METACRSLNYLTNPRKHTIAVKTFFSVTSLDNFMRAMNFHEPFLLQFGRGIISDDQELLAPFLEEASHSKEGTLSVLAMHFQGPRAIPTEGQFGGTTFLAENSADAFRNSSKSAGLLFNPNVSAPRYPCEISSQRLFSPLPTVVSSTSC